MNHSVKRDRIHLNPSVKLENRHDPRSCDFSVSSRVEFIYFGPVSFAENAVNTKFSAVSY